MSQCCICNRKIERDDPAVLAMGGAGIPRYLCDDCEKLLEELAEDDILIDNLREELLKIIILNMSGKALAWNLQLEFCTIESKWRDRLKPTSKLLMRGLLFDAV